MTLRVKIEIVPFGEEDKAYEIHRFDIFNRGQAAFGHHKYGVIEIESERSEGLKAGLYDKEFLHRRSNGAVALVAKVLGGLKDDVD